MVSEWQNTTVGNFAPFYYGKGLPERERNQTGLIPVYGSNGIVGYHNKALINEPAIIIGRKGTIGTVNYSKTPCWAIDTTFYVADVPYGDLLFTYYLLKYLQLDKFNFDSAVPGLNRDTAHNQKIQVPPLSEQKAIAHILGTIDDKIELNQQMNRNLEAIAQAIFKYWFEESLLGEIPKGWEIKPLDRIANFLNGLALQKYPPIDDEYLPAIKIAELRKGVTESSGRASSNIKTEYVVEDGDILFSWSGSLEVCIWCGGRGALNQHLFKVTSADYPKWFYYQWVKYYLPNFQAIAASKATTMGHIQRHHLTEAQVLVPPADTLQMMDKRMTPLLNRIVNNSLESLSLRAIRDNLLPKLMSGEIRVKEAEKILEDVA